MAPGVTLLETLKLENSRYKWFIFRSHTLHSAWCGDVKFSRFLIFASIYFRDTPSLTKFILCCANSALVKSGSHTSRYVEFLWQLIIMLHNFLLHEAIKCALNFLAWKWTRSWTSLSGTKSESRGNTSLVLLWVLMVSHFLHIRASQVHFRFCLWQKHVSISKSKIASFNLTSHPIYVLLCRRWGSNYMIEILIKKTYIQVPYRLSTCYA